MRARGMYHNIVLSTNGRKVRVVQFIAVVLHFIYLRSNLASLITLIQRHLYMQ